MDVLWMMLLSAPNSVLSIGLSCALLALWLWLWLFRRALRRRLKPTAGTRGRGGVFAFLVSLPIALLGAGTLLLSASLGGYRTFSHKTRVAELQCVGLEPGRARMYYVPIEANGTRGPTSIYEVRGDKWSIGAHLVRVRALLGALGVGPAYAITRVADNAVGGNRVWLSAEKDGVRGPLAVLVRDVHAQTLSGAPDRRAVYDLFVEQDGYTIEKRSY